MSDEVAAAKPMPEAAPETGRRSALTEDEVI